MGCLSRLDFRGCLALLALQVVCKIQSRSQTHNMAEVFLESIWKIVATGFSPCFDRIIDSCRLHIFAENEAEFDTLILMLSMCKISAPCAFGARNNVPVAQVKKSIYSPT